MTAGLPINTGSGKPGKSGPPGNKNAQKHGLYARDAGRMDLRTRRDRALVTTMAAIEADLGGPEALSAQKRVILESVRRKLKNVLKVDEYLDDRSIIDKRRRSLIPVVREQIQLLESIRRDLIDLGLERRNREPLSLREYLAANTDNDAVAEAQHPASASGEGTKR